MRKAHGVMVSLAVGRQGKGVRWVLCPTVLLNKVSSGFSHGLGRHPRDVCRKECLDRPPSVLPIKIGASRRSWNLWWRIDWWNNYPVG